MASLLVDIEITCHFSTISDVNREKVNDKIKKKHPRNFQTTFFIILLLLEVWATSVQHFNLQESLHTSRDLKTNLWGSQDHIHCTDEDNLD